MKNHRYFRILANGLILGGLVMALVALVGHAAAAPLAQAGTGTISGQVLSLDNQPLPNVRLAAYDQPQSTPNRVAVVLFQSDAQGRFSVQVPAGRIWLSFLTQDVLGQSFWGYDNLPVDVAAGATMTGADFRVAIRVVPVAQSTATLAPPPTAVPPTAVPPTAVPPTAVPPTAAPPPPTAVPPAPVPTPGMPATGGGSVPWAWPLAVLGLFCLAGGLAWRRVAR